MLITVMGVTFGFEYIVSKPNQFEVVKGMFIPWCKDCDSSALLQAVGIVGKQLHNNKNTHNYKFFCRCCDYAA